MEYIRESLLNNWFELFIYKKLSIYEILKEKEPIRMYLYCFYGYLEELKKYNLTQLKNNIMKQGNLFLLAIYSKHLNIVKYLYKKDPITFNLNNKIKSFLYNPYLLAVHMEDIKTAKYLEKIGCNVYAVDYVGNNAFLLAIKFHCKKMLRHLLLDPKSNKLSYNSFYINKLNVYEQNAYVTAFVFSRRSLMFLDKNGWGLNKTNYSIIKKQYFNAEMTSSLLVRINFIKRKNKYNALKTIILFI